MNWMQLMLERTGVQYKGEVLYTNDSHRFKDAIRQRAYGFSFQDEEQVPDRLKPYNNTVIDAANTGGPLRFPNHGRRKANCKAVGKW